MLTAEGRASRGAIRCYMLRHNDLPGRLRKATLWEPLVRRSKANRRRHILKLNRKRTTSMKRYMCVICGFIYSESVGLPEDGIAPGTKWSDIPMNWCCPDCSARKDEFQMIEI